MAKKGKKKASAKKKKNGSLIGNTRIPIVAQDAFSTWVHSLERRNDVAMLSPLARWHRLDFNMQHQQQTEWCWAAVGTSVSLYYKPKSTWTQCSIASKIKTASCCNPNNAGGAVCNMPASMTATLDLVDHLRQKAGAGPATFANCQTEVDAGNPIGVRVEWPNTNGKAHLLALIGYHELFQMVAVDDPLYGKSDLDYTALCTHYTSAGGVWKHNYLLK